MILRRLHKRYAPTWKMSRPCQTQASLALELDGREDIYHPLLLCHQAWPNIQTRYIAEGRPAGRALGLIS